MVRELEILPCQSRGFWLVSAVIKKCQSPTVGLPAPFGPRNPKTSPRFTLNEISATAVRLPNSLVRWLTSSAAAPAEVRGRPPDGGEGASPGPGGATGGSPPTGGWAAGPGPETRWVIRARLRIQTVAASMNN
jgi:hypothetical protein